MKLLKKILLVICWVVLVCSFLFGVVTEFVPINGSRDMSRFQVQWYQFSHYWYVWLSLVISGIGVSILTER